MIAAFLPDAPHARDAAATLLVAALAMGVGVLAGACRPAVALLAGWGLADLLLLGGGCAGVPLGFLLWPLALAGAAGWMKVARGALAPVPAAIGWRVLLLAAPLLVIAASITPAGFDEYSHWLPNLAYLVWHGHLPTRAWPDLVSVRPGYPPGLAFVGFAVSRLVGQVAEGAGIVWGALLAVALGGLGAELLLARRGGGGGVVGVAALGLLAATLLGPAFVPRLVFSNYGDAAAGNVAAGMAAALLLERESERPWRDAAVLGLGGVALVLIRQDAVLLLALLWLGALTATAPGRRLPLLAMLPAPLLGVAVWHVWQSTQIPGGAAGLLPPRDWHWPVLAAMLASMARVMLRHWALFALLPVLAAWAGRGRDGLPRAAARLGTVVGAGNVLVLALLYLAADFSPDQAAAATEFWRFSVHAGPTVTVMALLLVPAAALRWRPRAVAAAGAALALLLPLAEWPALRVDSLRQSPAAYLRAVAADIVARIPPATPSLLLVDTGDTRTGDLPHTMQMRYELLVGLRAGPDAPVPEVRLVEGDPPREFRIAGGLPGLTGADAAAVARAAPLLWCYDGGAAASRLAGLPLPPGFSALVAHDAAGIRLLQRWPLPARWR